MRRHRAIEVYSLAIERKRSTKLILRGGDNSFANDLRLVRRIITEQIAEIARQLPISLLGLAPQFYSSRKLTHFARRRSRCACPMITHKSEIPGNENFFRLKLNRALSISNGEGPAIGITQSRQRIQLIAGVHSIDREIIRRNRTRKITRVIRISPTLQRFPNVSRTATQ